MANIPRIAGAPDFGKLIAPEESLGKRLEGKRVLLTGTTKGVGRVTQELLCAQGAFVCGSGRSKGVAAEVANELVAKGYKAAGFDVDLSDYEAVKKWWPIAPSSWVVLISSSTTRRTRAWLPSAR